MAMLAAAVLLGLFGASASPPIPPGFGWNPDIHMPIRQGTTRCYDRGEKPEFERVRAAPSICTT